MYNYIYRKLLVFFAYKLMNMLNTYVANVTQPLIG